MKPFRIAYWIFTLLMCGMFLFSAQMYFFNTEMVNGFFTELNFPTWIVIPLAIAKVLGVITILFNINPILKEWAYAGFFFDAVLATAAHYHASHGWLGLSFGAIILVLGSRILGHFSSREKD